ncbi:MAG: Zn-dependent peptidase ImmA (M78 family) [Candidatus Azotimanducaceae bacterium]|jgi:Zn-dependent peptidase ImmA (M78 family)
MVRNTQLPRSSVFLVTRTGKNNDPIWILRLLIKQGNDHYAIDFPKYIGIQCPIENTTFSSSLSFNCLWGTICSSGVQNGERKLNKLDPRHEKVRNTQIEIFRESGVSYDDRRILDLIGPEPMAFHLGLSYEEWDEIPSGNAGFKVAGFLERSKNRIVVSKEFPAEQRRLTGMHEIVHWILHANIGRDKLHRDRPIDSVPKRTGYDEIEWEATHIACLCLMPEKLVKQYFAETFGLNSDEPIRMDEEVAFHLGMKHEKLENMSLRQRSLEVSTARRFGRNITPLHKQFKISPTAMAIRLEELDLVTSSMWQGKPNLQLVR